MQIRMKGWLRVPSDRSYDTAAVVVSRYRSENVAIFIPTASALTSAGVRLKNESGKRKGWNNI
jgi:hypothetical protein